MLESQRASRQLGGLALGGSFLRWQQVTGQIQEVRTRSENYYKQTFEPERTGRIANPVAFARDKIAEISGTGTAGHPIEEVMADLGEIFGQAQNKTVTLDVIRYNSEGFDCTGTAPDMTTVLNFRKAWEDRDNKAQVDNTQFVAGIGYRFETNGSEFRLCCEQHKKCFARRSPRICEAGSSWIVSTDCVERSADDA